ncbi:acyltransferase family protein [Anaeromyxobacter oryzae]|uniref:Acyltransferase n=1 Tax=Anaeromyxobacter oryzae TaxID=2918170 RepID=A0ABM7X1Y4_9BACT|nr:acyltransferase [Anaeromyxobacter oryzae]BDG05797.1 acyltransferase [Anaeromyxobacter oryzae]
MPSAPPRLGALTGLRFAAALAILLFHYGAPLIAGAPAWAGRLQVGGYAWVGLFYVLSGFVLAHAHPEPMGPPERRAFLAARLARLYPAYAIAFLLSAPFAAERWWDGGPVAAAKMGVVAVATLLLVHAWLPPIARLWNAPGWSTSVVASFYAAFPFVAARLGRLRRRGLLVALGAAWGLSLAFPLLYLALAPDGPGAVARPHEPPWLLALKFHPVPRAGEFLAGVSLGLLHRRGLALPRGGGAIAGVALAAAAAIIASGRAPYVLLHNGLLVPLYAIALLGLARGDGLLAGVLSSTPARTLGDAAFALYALQEPLWRWARLLAGAERAPASPAFVIAFCAAATGIAVAVSVSFERPVRRWLRARLSAEPPRRGAEAGGR